MAARAAGAPEIAIPRRVLTSTKSRSLGMARRTTSRSPGCWRHRRFLRESGALCPGWRTAGLVSLRFRKLRLCQHGSDLVPRTVSDRDRESGGRGRWTACTPSAFP